MRRFFVMAVVAAFAVVGAPAAFAATATPFGGATVNDGILTLVSNTGDAGSTNDASGAAFSDTGVTTFSSITQLSAEFNVTDDDSRIASPNTRAPPGLPGEPTRGFEPRTPSLRVKCSTS